MERIYLDRDWNFSETFTEDMIDRPMTNGTPVTVPHTVKELPFHYFDEHDYQMVSCYQRTLFGEAAWTGKRILLTFEAVGHYAKLYVNGRFICDHKNGYTAFTVDLASFLQFGAENLITLVVDSNETVDQPPFGFVIDYLTYGGIYRDVYLQVKDPISMDDVFYQPNPAAVKTQGMEKNEIEKVITPAMLVTDLTLSDAGQEAANAGRLRAVQYLDGRKIFDGPLFGDGRISTDAGKVAIWDIESPAVYTVVTELYAEGRLVDSDETSIGFRKMEFKADGFYLNGRKVKIRGLNRHQSYAYVGYAMPESMQRLDAEICKEELGLNAVRTSHYPQSHYFIDECDRRGLLVFTEMPGWQHIGGDAWKDIAVHNTEEMILQWRNHPSIMLWGVRINESPDDDEFYKRTNEVAHRLDPTRSTGGVRCIKNSHLFEDVYTYNDFIHSGSNAGCEPKKKVTSDMEKAYFISEYNGHMFPTKTFDCEEHRREHMLRHARVLDAVAGEEDIAGSFGWCMFDYNTHKDFGSGDRICYHGVMDMFRNKKLAASVYAAQQDEVPVLAFSSSMDIGEHPACMRGRNYMISNADSIRVYKNDKLLKEYFIKDSEFKNLKHGPIVMDEFVAEEIREKEGYTKRQAQLVRRLLDKIALENGQTDGELVWIALQLVLIYHMNPNDAYPLFNKYVGDWGGTSSEYRFEAVKNGQVVRRLWEGACTDVSMHADKSTGVLRENHTYDVAEIRLRACDQYNNVVPFYDESVKVSIEGPLELIGPDLIPFRGGMTGLYVKTIGQAGKATVTLTCGNLEPLFLEFEIKKED